MYPHCTFQGLQSYHLLICFVTEKMCFVYYSKFAWVGIEQTRVGIEQTRVGIEQTRVGIEQTRVGIE